MNSLIGLNIVLLANKHNPSIISKEWVKENGLINGQIVNFAHLPVAAIVEDLDYNLLVEESSLRITVKNIDESTKGNLPTIIQKYTEKLPEIPYTALGFNFLFKIDQNPENFKKVFIADDNKAKAIFSEDYSFGVTIKFNYIRYLVTAIIIPENDNETKIDFNFHSQINNIKEINQILNDYPKTLEKSKNILNELFKD